MGLKTKLTAMREHTFRGEGSKLKEDISILLSTSLSFCLFGYQRESGVKEVDKVKGGQMSFFYFFYIPRNVLKLYLVVCT